MSDQPIRIQRKRVKGWKMPENTKYVGRGTRYGNPFNKTQIGLAFQHQGFPIPIVYLYEPAGLGRCLDLHAAHLYATLSMDAGFLAPLKGKNLACWCPLDQPCHADLLLLLANLEDHPQ